MTVSSPERPFWIVVRFSLAAAVLGFLANAYEVPLVERVLPLFRIWFNVFDDSYRTTELAVMGGGSDEYVIRRTATMRPHVVDTHVVMGAPGLRFQNVVGAGLVLQPIVLGFALVFAWPCRRSGSALVVRAAVLIPLLLAVVMFDTPALLWDAQWLKEEKLLNVEQELSPLAHWADVMNSGGRFVLSAICAVIAIWASARLVENDARRRQPL